MSSAVSSRPRRTFRQLHGVLLLDKAGGITSNKALQQVRHLFNAKKAGHTGNLDPLATGMLPVCFGEATKISAYLLDADKAYSAVAQLGSVTDTGDSDGTVIQQRPLPAGLDTHMLETALGAFRGHIEQVPPMYSALKHEGRRLHELARAGKTVERKPRSVVISMLEMTGFGQGSFSIDVRCSKGTYIRSLVQDIGEALGCGAHLTALRRTAVSPFHAEPMLAFDTLHRLHDKGGLEAIDRHLLCLDTPLQHLPSVTLEVEDVIRFRHGNPAGADKLVPGSNMTLSESAAAGIAGTAPDRTAVAAATSDGSGTLVRVYAPDRQFIGIGVASNASASDTTEPVARAPDTYENSSDHLLIRPRRVLNLST